MSPYHSKIHTQHRTGSLLKYLPVRCSYAQAYNLISSLISKWTMWFTNGQRLLRLTLSKKLDPSLWPYTRAHIGIPACEPTKKKSICQCMINKAKSWISPILNIKRHTIVDITQNLDTTSIMLWKRSSSMLLYHTVITKEPCQFWYSFYYTVKYTLKSTKDVNKLV